MRSVTLALAIGALTLTAACNRKPEKAEAPAAPAAAPAPVAAAPVEPHITVDPGFAHQAQFDASGYYLSAQPVQTGPWKLTNIGVGAPSDFAQWEEGDRASVFGPILFQFEDTTSPRQVSETGQESHSVSVRVLPQAYRFEAGKVTFKGSDPKLGEVLFTGSFDAAALQKARNEGVSAAPVLRGKLKVGDAPARDVALNYWTGD